MSSWWVKAIIIAVISGVVERILNRVLNINLWGWIFKRSKRKRLQIGINIDPHFQYSGHGGIRGTLSYISFCMRIDFRNNTKNETNVMISDINLYPSKEIELFSFEFKKGIYQEIKSNPITDFSISPGSKLVYFKFNIKGNKKFGLNDVERYKSIPVIFEIRYSLSPDFKEETEEIKIEKFFNNLVETVKNKKIF